ncbi:MAG: lysine--tRNA ligase [Nanoarchaeota archaeon]|nr:lysine--tRNA ligase [Nanoarchaeota archaeon]
MTEDKLIQERIDKLGKIRELGVDPYPYTYDHKHHSTDILDKYHQLKVGEDDKKAKLSVAGRILLKRDMGKAAFVTIRDQKGDLQLYFRKDDIGEESYKLFKLLDLGDIIGVTGHIFKTKRGELTIYVKELSLLTKSLRPLPEKFHGLKDDEIRYRHRELDLIMNPDTRETLRKRSLILKYIRDFMEEKGFLEMTTPILQTVYGGANARPFVTQINAWDMPMYLKISPELFLKRLVVGGFEKVYDMNYNFRNEGVDKTHNPEFYMLEFYQAYADREKVMELTEELWKYVAVKLLDTTEVKYGDTILSLKRPWKRYTMKDAIKEFGKIDVDKLSDEELFDLRITYNIDVEGDLNRGMMIELLFEELVEDKLIQPTHILDHPIESTPLCKPTKYSDEHVERVEPYMMGWEIGNGYSELTDPILQRKLMDLQVERGRGGDEEAHPMDEDFMQAIETGLPPAGGMGVGVERMIMILTGAETIRDVLPFPIMKPEQ